MKKIIKLLCLGASLGLPLSFYVTTTGCAGDQYHRATGAYLDDKAIATKVKMELLADPEVKGTQVKIESFQSKVVLSGFVDNEAQKTRAAEIARRVKGVEWVKNNILVKSVTPAAAGAQTGGITTEQPAEKSNQP